MNRQRVVTPEQTIAERVARNESTFRSANDRIQAAATRLVDDEPIPFICECSDERCTQIVTLSLGDYEHVREDSRRFLTAIGHEICEVDGVTVAKVLEQREGYSLLEKVGLAAELAAELDERG